MRIVVCIKQILDPATVRVTSRGDLSTQDGERIINPADLCALEEALKLKDALGAEVIALTLGAAEAEDALREALSMGADRAVLLTGEALAGGDAAAAGYVLARAVATLDQVDLILVGERSGDDAGNQVGPAMAEHLGLPQIRCARRLAVGNGEVSAQKSFEDGHRRLSAALPCLITIATHSNRPRLATAANIMNVYTQTTIETWDAAAIGADPALVGAAGSPTTIRRSFPPEAMSKGELLAGAPHVAAQALVARLRKRGLI